MRTLQHKILHHAVNTGTDRTLEQQRIGEAVVRTLTNRLTTNQSYPPWLLLIMAPLLSLACG